MYQTLNRVQGKFEFASMQLGSVALTCMYGTANYLFLYRLSLVTSLRELLMRPVPASARRKSVTAWECLGSRPAAAVAGIARSKNQNSVLNRRPGSPTVAVTRNT